jgi:hypothetical protein
MLKIALVTCSLLALAAVGALATAIRIDPVGSWPFVYFAAVGLMLQGSFTLVVLSRRARRWRSFLDAPFVVGEVAAAIAGATMFVTNVLYNLNPRHGDYEFAPLGIAVVITAHAIVGLIWAGRNLDFSAFAESREPRHSR